MYISSHRLKVQEKNLKKKFFKTVILLIVSVILVIFVGLPVLARLAVGLSLLKGNETQNTIKENNPLFPPSLEPLPEATNSATITVAGVSDKDREVVISVNNREIQRLETDELGKFTARGISLEDGENTVSVVIEKDNQKSNPATQTITYKKEAPEITISEPVEGQVFCCDQKDVIIKGTTNEDAKLSINERYVIVDRDGGFSYKVTLNDGENTIKLKSEDNAGNIKEIEFKLTYNP